eukprot:scaffold22484_cov60-Phaeocystis_antarctica.AAC.3
MRHTGRETGGRGVGGGSASSAQGGDCCGRARAERTLNMAYMFVTLDVSKLSGWLNAVVSCRVEREA